MAQTISRVVFSVTLQGVYKQQLYRTLVEEGMSKLSFNIAGVGERIASSSFDRRNEAVSLPERETDRVDLRLRLLQ